MIVDERRNVPDVRVDRVPEEQQQHHGQHDHHGERQPVAAELQELLPRDDKRLGASCFRPHHRDERVLDGGPRLDGTAHDDAMDRERGALASATGSPPLAWPRSAVGARSARPPRRPSLRAGTRPLRGRARPRARRRAAAALDDLVGRSHVEQRTPEDERQPVAALGLVHVVRRQDGRRALARRWRRCAPRTRGGSPGRRRRSARRGTAAAARGWSRRRARRAASIRRRACRRAAGGGRPGPRARGRASTRARRRRSGTP